MRSGSLRYIITLLSYISTIDEFGSKSEYWFTYESIRAGLIYKGGNKNITDEERFNTSNIDFTCRYDKNINEQMRILFNEKLYKISALNKNPFDNSLIISCELIVGVNDDIVILNIDGGSASSIYDSIFIDGNTN